MKIASILVTVTLFLGIANISLSHVTVPDTGQNTCYDNLGVIPCPQPGEPFYGQDASYSISQPLYVKLDENGNQLPSSAAAWSMVFDKVTGLIWETKTDDGSIHDSDNRYSWYDAQDLFIAQLNADQFGGHSDWRIPTIKELASIVRSDRYSPAIDTNYFPATVISNYWTSTPGPRSDQARYITFENGTDSWYWKVGEFWVRAVRGGREHENIFVENGNGTVSDLSTGLTWQQNQAGPMNWESAIAYCEGLSLGGHTDWRLPSIKELRSIMDYTRTNPAIDTTYFPGTLSSFFWSSTTVAENHELAAQIYIWYGTIGFGNKPDVYYVRAVRGGLSLPFPGDTKAPTGSVHAYPNLIWPPNNKKVTVVIAGCVVDELSVARDGQGIGVSSAFLLINGNEKIVLRGDEIDLLDPEGRYQVEIKVKATKGAKYIVELYASDTNPETPNGGLVDMTHISVNHNE